MTRVTVLNPLGGALAHYSRVLQETLTAAGAEVTVRSFPEPSLGGGGRTRWALRQLRELRHSQARRGGRTLVTWPVLGYWDVLAARCLAGSGAAVVLHDPQPLARAIGYSRLPALAAGLGAETLVHSAAAQRQAAAMSPRIRLRRVAHPVARPQPPPSEVEPVIRVLGQFKTDRDLSALDEIAAGAPPGWRLEISGRGWPPVPGWTVTNRFLSEAEFEWLIRSAAAVVIPYRRFFQSGVAVRAVEHSRPVVGPRGSSLADLLGQGSPWLVGEGGWVEALRRALNATEAELQGPGLAAAEGARQEWAAWLSSGPERRLGPRSH